MAAKLHPRFWLPTLVTGATIIGALAILGSAIAKPSRVASINLCTDQLLLAIADRDQIVGVSIMAGNKNLSFLSGLAHGIPGIRGNAEELLRIRADLVLMGTHDRPLVKNILRNRNAKTLPLKAWRTIEMGQKQIMRLSEILGQKERGIRIVSEIKSALTYLRDNARRHSPGKSIIVLQRRGYVLRSGLVNQLLRIAGFKDIAGQMKPGASGIVSLEKIVSQRPDFIVVESSITDPADQGEAKLVHPALQHLYPKNRRMVLPSILGICGGPSTAVLIRQLADEIIKKVR